MWYCLVNTKQYGPFGTEEAINFIARNPDCMVWRKGMPAWTRADKFSVLTGGAFSVPPASSAFHSDLSFRICGDDLQYIELALDPEQSVIAEPGSMIYKEAPVVLDAMLGGNQDKGFLGRVMSAGKRVLSGERAFLSVFTNTSAQDAAKVAFAAPYPGKIIPVSLATLGGELVCQKDSFLCAEPQIDIGVYFQRKILTALFGGAGFIMQRLSGNGVVFINAGGSIAEFDLRENETVQIDAGCLVAFTPDAEFSIQDTGSFKSQIFGGSGLFFATLKGPGKVWVQSLPFSRLAGKFVSRITIEQK